MKLLSTRWLLAAALVFAVGVSLWFLHEAGKSPELSPLPLPSAPVPAEASAEPPASGPPVVAAVPPPVPPKMQTPPVTAISPPPPVTALPPVQPAPPPPSAVAASAATPAPAPVPGPGAPAAEPAIDKGGGRGVAAVRPPAGRSLADILDGVDLANPAARTAVAAKIKEQQTQRKTAAWVEADKLGLPKRIEEPGGRIIDKQVWTASLPPAVGRAAVGQQETIEQRIAGVDAARGASWRVYVGLDQPAEAALRRRREQR